MRFTPTTLKWGMRVWPPYAGAGIVVRRIAPDWSSVTVDLLRLPTNPNAFGTAFGGSLSAMTDPFYCLMLSHRLGRDYLVWDTAGEIRFVKPGRTKVRAVMSIDQEIVDQIKRETEDGSRSLTWFDVDITDTHGDPVAHVRRQVYARRKRTEVPAPAAD